VCVLGAGVVGLSTAEFIQDLRPDLKVTLLADKFLEDTTSNGAAGIFRPSASNFKAGDPATTKQWIEDSYRHYRKVLESPDAVEAGVKEIYSVVLATEHEHITKNALLEELLPEYRFLDAKELASYAGGPYRFGAKFRTLIVENKRYLPFLLKKFKSRGGVVVNRRIESFEELAAEFDFVVNCTGFGSRALCKDSNLTPIRGQVLKVRAPWIKQCYYSDYDTYIIPGFDLVTIGGCRQFDSWNAEVDRHDTAAILERVAKLMPSLKNIEVVKQWCGFRPYRPEVRVEVEQMHFGNRELTVVHNYGHGGYGVTGAPGTSLHAVRLLTPLIPLASKL